MSKHKTRPSARDLRKAQNKADRRAAAAYLALRPVRVVEELAVGGADEPYHVDEARAVDMLRARRSGFGRVFFDAEDDRVWAWEGEGAPTLLDEEGFTVEALDWLRSGGGRINTTLPGCAHSEIQLSRTKRGDLRRVQRWVRDCRRAGHPVRTA